MFGRRFTTDPIEGLLRGWTDRDRRLLLRAAGRVEYEPGDVLASEGCLAKEFVLLTSGRADLVRQGRRVGVLEPGGHLGAVALLHRTTYESTAVTDRFCQALVLGARDFNGLLHAAPSFGRLLSTGLADIIVSQPAGLRAVPGVATG